MLSGCEVGVLHVTDSLTCIVHCTSHLEGVLYDVCMVFAIRPIVAVLVFEVSVTHCKAGIILAVIGQAFKLIIVELYTVGYRCRAKRERLVGVGGVERCSVVNLGRSSIERVVLHVKSTDGRIAVGAADIVDIACVVSDGIIAVCPVANVLFIVAIEQGIKCIVVIVEMCTLLWQQLAIVNAIVVMVLLIVFATPRATICTIVCLLELFLYI